MEKQHNDKGGGGQDRWRVGYMRVASVLIPASLVFEWEESNKQQVGRTKENGKSQEKEEVNVGKDLDICALSSFVSISLILEKKENKQQ